MPSHSRSASDPASTTAETHLPCLINPNERDIACAWSGAAYLATEKAVRGCPPLQSWRSRELGVVMMV